ncbi:hypothetical protein EYZ11_009341 [Aspergillus tanneri]|uniref:Uncharacterized protein n=1 Tax=Aspergillus tanneri TaxID=1220188 RepID=A0A4S3J8I8_9EURO|nr:hypothetical protein EYZ11_009341 [Aspergillus tanneri]
MSQPVDLQNSGERLIVAAQRGRLQQRLLL